MKLDLIDIESECVAFRLLLPLIGDLYASYSTWPQDSGEVRRSYKFGKYNISRFISQGYVSAAKTQSMYLAQIRVVKYIRGLLTKKLIKRR